MPATNIDEIFRFEDTVVAATVAALNTDTVLGSLAYGPRKVEGMPAERIDVRADGFAKASEQQVYAQSRHWDSHYAGPLTVTIVTVRGGAAGPSHAQRVGRVRYLMSPKAALFTSTNLPLWEVLALEEAAPPRYAFDDRKNTDETELTFTLHLGIRASAFPA